MKLKNIWGALCRKLAPAVSRSLRWAVPMVVALSAVGSLPAGVLTDDFSSTTGKILGRTKVDQGILKLVDLADLLPGVRLPLQGSYVY